MIPRIWQRSKRQPPSALLGSRLFNDLTFYPAFVGDLRRCKSEVIIESPFMTTKRVNSLLPALRKLRKRGVTITVNTRDPQEHDGFLRLEAQKAINILQDAGVRVLYTGGHHRKLAIIDREILWEGSLNILSQNDSCEIMRRIESEEMAREMLEYTGLQKWVK